MKRTIEERVFVKDVDAAVQHCTEQLRSGCYRVWASRTIMPSEQQKGMFEITSTKEEGDEQFYATI